MKRLPEVRKSFWMQISLIHSLTSDYRDGLPGIRHDCNGFRRPHTLGQHCLGLWPIYLRYVGPTVSHDRPNVFIVGPAKIMLVDRTTFNAVWPSIAFSNILHFSPCKICGLILKKMRIFHSLIICTTLKRISIFILSVLR